MTKNEIFIGKAKIIHGDKYDYSKVDYVNAKTKVCIICKKHGEFLQSPNKHLIGNGCPKCIGRGKTNDDFINEAKKIHGSKYDYSKVEYVNTSTKVCIICKEHGEFWQTPHGHLSGKGCIRCAKKEKLTTEKFIEKAKKVHGELYDYSKVKYINANTKVCIICKEHGEFWQAPNAHLNGKKCSKCAKNKLYTQNEFIECSKRIHGDKYDYSKVEYVNARTKVCIICPIHGEFWQTPYSHLQGHECKMCSVEIVKGKKKLSIEEFIEKANEVHGKKYDYSKVDYVNSHTKVCIICPKHGEFWQTPNSHLSGSGCKKCKKTIIEKEIEELLISLNIEYIYQARKSVFSWLGRQSLDFYLPQYNIAIECQGEQHFRAVDFWGGEEGFKRRKILDNIKKNTCISNNIKLLYYINDIAYIKKELYEASNKKNN